MPEAAGAEAPPPAPSGDLKLDEHLGSDAQPASYVPKPDHSEARPAKLPSCILELDDHLGSDAQPAGSPSLERTLGSLLMSTHLECTVLLDPVKVLEDRALPYLHIIVSALCNSPCSLSAPNLAEKGSGETTRLRLFHATKLLNRLSLVSKPLCSAVRASSVWLVCQSPFDSCRNFFLYLRVELLSAGFVDSGHRQSRKVFGHERYHHVCNRIYPQVSFTDASPRSKRRVTLWLVLAQ